MEDTSSRKESKCKKKEKSNIPKVNSFVGTGEFKFSVSRIESASNDYYLHIRKLTESVSEHKWLKISQNLTYLKIHFKMFHLAISLISET